MIAPAHAELARVIYTYHGVDGQPVYETVRDAPKTFRQRRVDGHGGHTWSLDEVERVPYRLPDLRRRIASGDTPYVVEGEKDAEALLERRLCATTNAGGASWNYTPSFVQYFAGAGRIVVIPDCDVPGRKAAAARADALSSVCDDVRIVDLAPDRSDGYDVSDWLGDGHTIEELGTLLEAAPKFETSEEPISNTSSREDEIVWEERYPFPIADRAAMYGLAGEIVETIAADTEADPMAMLITLLVAFGNAAGPASYARVSSDDHPPRLFASIVMDTAGGKGMSLAAVRPFLEAADSSWLSAAYVSGFGSGEAIIARLSGKHRTADDDGPIERRAFVVEPEFARMLTVNGRDSSTSSPVIRGAWDSGRLQLIRVDKSMLAESTHVSILAHITADELRTKLSSNDVAGGFANRFLFVVGRRSKRLPSPPPLNPRVVGDFAKRLREALDFARAGGVLQRSDAAEQVWSEFYHDEPDREGIVGSVTARSAAQKLRLSVAYALLDQSLTIEADHVLAAEAVWRYCAASAEHIFASMRGDDVQDRLLDEARRVYPEALDGTAQRDLFRRHARGDRIATARKALADRGLISIETEKTGGRDRASIRAIPLRPCDESDRSSESPCDQTRHTLFGRLRRFGRTAAAATSGMESLEVFE